MGRVTLNYSSLKKGCIDPLRDTINELNKVETYFSLMNIPHDYIKRTEVQRANEELKKCNSKLKELKTWIEGSNSDFNNKIEDHEYRINRLPDGEMIKRGQRI